jgi:hypothetical protein
VGKEKLDAKGKEGLRGERLSLVHRYMTDAAANAAPRPQPTDIPTTPPEPAKSPPPAKASALPPEPESTSAEGASIVNAEKTSASQLLDEPHLPIYGWSRADATKGESRREVDWAHELLRLREERDQAGETPS